MNGPPRILVVSHPRSTSTRAVTERLVAGIAEGGGIADVREPPAADLDAVTAAGAVVLVGPEYFGYMSGLVKDFLERVYDPARERGVVRPCAVVVTAGNDGEGALRSVEPILTGLHWRNPLPPLLVRSPAAEADLERAFELGATLAAGVEAGIFG
mgnify:FL=1